MPDCDVLTVHHAHLSGVSDQEIADWANAHDRVIVTQDGSTMPGAVVRRMRSGQFVPGLVVTDLTRLSRGAAAEELVLIAEGSLPGELANRVVFLPLLWRAQREARNPIVVGRNWTSMWQGSLSRRSR